MRYAYFFFFFDAASFFATIILLCLPMPLFATRHADAFICFSRLMPLPLPLTCAALTLITDCCRLRCYADFSAACYAAFRRHYAFTIAASAATPLRATLIMF